MPAVSSEQFYCAYCGNECKKLRAKITEMRVNDSRYRWLRQNINIGSSATGHNQWSIVMPDPGVMLDTGDVFDAAIDAMLRKEMT